MEKYRNADYTTGNGQEHGKCRTKLGNLRSQETTSKKLSLTLIAQGKRLAGPIGAQ